MSKCSNCNFELNGSIFCPMCGTKAEVTVNTTEKESAPIVEETFVQEQPEQVVEQPQNNQAPPVQPQQFGEQSQQNSVPQGQFQQLGEQPQGYSPVQPQQAPTKPSVFAKTFKQAFKCVKYFFSKDAVDAISVQHNEKLNVWIILFIIPALFSAIACCIHGGSPTTDLLDIICMPFSLGTNRFAWFVSGLLLMFAFEFSCVIATFLYSKIIKKKPIAFIGCANLISTSFIPVTLVTAFSVIAGVDTGILNVIALLMFAFFWKKGMDNAHGEDNKKYWVFFILFAAALIIYTTLSSIISAPGWISDAVNKYTVASGLQGMLDPYSW